MSMRTLLVIHPGALGDVLLSRPALQALHRLYPSHRLGLVAGGEVGRLLEACGAIDCVFPVESRALTELLGGPDSLAPHLRRWLLSCDVVVAWMNDPDGALRATLASFEIPSVIVGSARGQDPGAAPGLHQSERFRTGLSGLGGIEERAQDRLPLNLPDSVRTAASAWLTEHGFLGRAVAALHPGSGSVHKCVSPELWAAVIPRLTALGMAPVLIEGPADGERVESLARACRIRPPILAGLSVLDLAGVLAQTALYIGHDSGVSHLAAAVGCPTVVLFGPTDYRRWAPLGPVRVLSGAPCRCHTWTDVQTCSEKVCLALSLEDIVALAWSAHLVLP